MVILLLSMSRMKQEIVQRGLNWKNFMNKYVPLECFQRVLNLRLMLLGLLTYHGKFYCIINIGNDEPLKGN